MVPFAGYALPVQYPTGVLKEHTHTRSDGCASLFDVSHMGQVLYVLLRAPLWPLRVRRSRTLAFVWRHAAAYVARTPRSLWSG